jgi:hypothetical protein
VSNLDASYPLFGLLWLAPTLRSRHADQTNDCSADVLWSTIEWPENHDLPCQCTREHLSAWALQMAEKITLPGRPGHALKSRRTSVLSRRLTNMIRAFGLPLALASVAVAVSWEATPFSPASVPLAVRSPYLSTWLPGSTPLNGGWAQHWAGATTAWTGYVKVCSEQIYHTQ